VIGPSPATANLWLAFGHQHIGLTLGPLTGRIVADLVAGRDPGLDLSPYRPDRPV
jgi:D-amino-acid dehydrogenase